MPRHSGAAIAVAPHIEPETILHRSVLPLYNGQVLEYIIHRHQTTDMSMIRIMSVSSDDDYGVVFALSAHKHHDPEHRMEILTSVGKLITELEAFRKTVELYNEE